MAITKERKERNELAKEKTSERLTELLRGRTQISLLRETEERFGSHFSMLPSHLTEIIKKKRPLPQEFAIKFADVLNVDPGYLLGFDEYKASNYSEYLKMRKHEEDVQLSFSEFDKVNLLMHLSGYSVEESAGWVNQKPDYVITANDKTVEIPASAMDKAIEDINLYIKMRIDYLVNSCKEA